MKCIEYGWCVKLWAGSGPYFAVGPYGLRICPLIFGTRRAAHEWIREMKFSKESNPKAVRVELREVEKRR